MAMLPVEILEGTYAPTASGTTNLALLLPAGHKAGRRVISFSCRVTTAGNGTGTVSFGYTGSAAAYMSTTEVGAGATGQKLVTTTGPIDGVLTSPPASDVFVTGTYTVGTNTVHPVIRWRAVTMTAHDYNALVAIP